jgi:acyl-CoA thioester hydrolase
MARIKLSLPASFSFKTEIPIRIYDINYGGHLGNDAVLSIVHEARIQFLENLGYSELDIEGCGVLMTDAVVVYSSEGFYGDILTVEVGINDIQSAYCDFIFLLKNRTTGNEVARAKTGMVFMNRQTHKISSIPEEFRKKCV